MLSQTGNNKTIRIVQEFDYFVNDRISCYFEQQYVVNTKYLVQEHRMYDMTSNWNDMIHMCSKSTIQKSFQKPMPV